MIIHKITYKKEEKDLESKVNVIYRKAVDIGAAGDFEVIFQAAKDVAHKIIDPRVFHFRENNKANLMNIRAEVGKELTKRIQSEDFNNFKVSFGSDNPPSDEQRGYYFGIVLPTIQEHFKAEGNFMKIEVLHEAIKECLKEEEGLTSERVNPITGEAYQGQITISNAGNKAETMKYIDAVIRFAAGYGIIVPECLNKGE